MNFFTAERCGPQGPRSLYLNIIPSHLFRITRRLRLSEPIVRKGASQRGEGTKSNMKAEEVIHGH